MWTPIPGGPPTIGIRTPLAEETGKNADTFQSHIEEMEKYRQKLVFEDQTISSQLALACPSDAAFRFKKQMVKYYLNSLASYR